MRYFCFAVMCMFNTTGCKSKPQEFIYFNHVHVIACSYCGYETPNCVHTKITVIDDDGIFYDVYEPEGFQCSLYNYATYWDLTLDNSLRGLEVVSRKISK